MLDQVAFHPTEGKVLVEGAVTDTIRRLKDGDGTFGWEGDPNMEVCVDLETGLYDVWTLGLDGEPALVAAGKPYCDGRLIEDVIRADTRRFDVLARIDAKNASVKKAHDEKAADERAEFADRLHLALMSDCGHHYGGLSRRLF